MATQRISGATPRKLDDISREISVRLKEFEATLRVVDALRVVLDEEGSIDAVGGRGDALLKRLLGGDPATGAVRTPARSADGPSTRGVPVDLAARPLELVPVLVIATTPYRGRDQVGVVGLTEDGRKRVVTFQEGSTADPVAMDNLCLHLEQRGLSPHLCVTDGGGALDREIADSFRACLVAHADPYVERAVLSHLAAGPAQAVKTRLRDGLGHTGREAEPSRVSSPRSTCAIAATSSRRPGPLSKPLPGSSDRREFSVRRPTELAALDRCFKVDPAVKTG